jgi:hypothetical protein
MFPLPARCQLTALFSSVILVVAAPAASGSHPLDTLAPMTWFEVPNSAVSTSGQMYQYPAGTYFGNSPHIRFFDESGASYDSVRNRMVVFGGGHGDYAGNEIMTFDIDTLKWIRINDPSPRFDETGLIERSGYYPDAYGNPDLQQPRSRHSYWSQIYVPTIDRYCAISSFGTFPIGLGASHVDCFDFATRLWSQKKDAPNAGGLLTSTFDPSTNRVWVMGNRGVASGYLAEWDAATDTWTRRSTSPSGVNDRSGPLLDTKRRRLVFLGGGAVRMFDLNQSGMLASQLITLQGDVEIINRDRPGFAYDPVNDKYVAYSGVESGGTRDIYVIDPVTWISTRTTLGGSVAPAIPASVDTGGWFNGIYGRLAYIPTKNAFIFINNHIKDSVFFFKLSSPAGANVSASPASLAFGNITIGQTSGAQAITVSNTGAASATNVVYPAAPARFNKSGTCSGATLNAGTSCTIVLTYTPTATVTDNATYTITGGGSTIPISLSGTGVSAPAASLSASPTSLSFGNNTVGTTSATHSIVVSNMGGAAATAIAFANSNAARFPLQANTCGATLNPGATCTLNIAYAPNAANTDTGIITLSSAGAGNIAISLSGTGIAAPSASLSAAPPLAAFGTVTVGQTSAAIAITVRNTGGGAATGLSLANSSSAEFLVSGNTCGVTLPSGASCGLSVAYAPKTLGAHSATLMWTFSGGSLSVSLSGTSVAVTPPAGGQLSMPAIVSLPNQPSGTAGGPQSVTVRNTSSTAVTVTSITSSNAGEFPVTGSNCASLSAGASCTFNVTFAPFAAGARSATIAVASNLAPNPQSIQAVGTGLSGIAPLPSPPNTTAGIEYYHAGFNHYFITAIADEIVKLDNGTFLGWTRTSKQFNVNSAPAIGLSAACRFFSTAFGLKSAHFYTPDSAECATVMSNTNWQFEGEVFFTMSPGHDGSCPVGTIPVYRMYNDGLGGAPNHRYTIDPSIRALMLAQGWIAEGYGTVGVIMCVPP